MSSIKIKLKEKDVAKIIEICDSFNNNPRDLVNVLHRVQGEFGYLPAEVQEVVSNQLKVSLAKIYGVVTFYSVFTMIPRGKHPISGGTGTACYVRGAEKVLDEFKKVLGIKVGESTPDGKFSLTCLRCVGACGLAPVVQIGEKTFGRMAPDDVKRILDEYADN